MSGAPVRPPQRGGFVLALVVMMLFAISVAGATGYLVVSTEFTLAKHSAQGAEALTVARAGLHRFVAEQIGVVGDSVSYAIGNGVALVTTKKVAEEDSLNHIYYIRAEGTVDDPQTPGAPARRVVGALAYHRKRPLRPHAAFLVAADRSYVEGVGARIDGTDHSSPADCPGGGASPITGTVARVITSQILGGVLAGSPGGEQWAGGYPAVYDSVAIRWDVLTDPNFPVDFDGSPPNFSALPADSFPVVRVSGYFNPGSSWSGRGLLIVDGQLDAGPSFTWDGIILAGSVDDIHEGHVRGMLVGGLAGPNPFTSVYWRGTIQYYSCNVYAANEALSYMDLIEDTMYETR